MPRIRFSQQKPGTRDYDVLRQERRGGQWEKVGQVLGFGDAPGGWAALGKDADAWTTYFGTRSAATQEMLAGHTFKTRQLEADRAELAAREHEHDMEAEL
jgi:hypothetical protein